MTEELGEYDVLDILTGYQPAAALATAVRLGVFDAVLAGAGVADADPDGRAGAASAVAGVDSGAGVSANEVAERCGSAPAATRALLDALVGLRLLAAADGPPDERSYLPTPIAARLSRGGDLVDLVGKESYLAGEWQQLHRAVQSGTPTIAPWRARVADDPETARSFLRALVTLARLTGPDLAALPELTATMPPGARPRHVVDVGGGLGSYAVPLAGAGASVTLVELPAVAAWAAEDTAATPGVTVLAADVLADGEPSLGVPAGTADAVLVSHLLHDLDDAAAALLLARARAALAPSGALVVLEIPGDAAGLPGAFGPLFDLMMQIETPGRARLAPELIRMLEAAGFVAVRSAGVPAPNLVLVGEAP
ncbi:acetylserotonin O-methyltransferase [Herbiconiux moechotypicola]|uniref:Methyltransferase domain-containing protein n=1 Tax=Herbiconiux moechotypicola TaxID=637393 RepID=A0ABP5QGJ6_9MICO|nr:acetylserotonin O-methyltransferase [Herbiconiux moechotypicola]MCS5730075.1 acetylserotonin O-methyltransferase [Herbiconiux moechotypicola]